MAKTPTGKNTSGRGTRDLTVKVRTAKGRTISSTRWLERQLNDPYVKRARAEGYRGRAAFKIMELDDRFRFLVPGARVVDLGCAPGGWCQVAVPRINALGDKPGTLVLSGTGSMAWAQNGADIVRVGGWGHGFGDEGSAYWIGHRAVTLLSHALDGRLDAPEFTRAMLKLIGIADRRDPDKALTEWFYALPHPRPMLAALAQGIDGLAASGDTTALRIFDEAADELAALVRTARKRCPQAGDIWSYAGGSFASPALKAAMTARLGTPVPPALPPIGGAVWRAAKMAGWPIDAAWISRLAASLANFKPASINLHAVDER
ncbi:MAG: hypothetical protein LCH62_12950 [Proteobacteria bacterium]|nr:hypothetical protein [Pseudomonadota bacterium]